MNTDGAKFRQLKTLLIAQPGDQAVTLVFEGNSKEHVKLPFKISWSQRLARQISEILEGKGHSDVQ